MLRNVTLDEISDGRLYKENDMVKADTNSCVGCRQVCCQNMGKTIVLDPLDIFHLSIAAGKTFEQLLDVNIELNVVDGVTLPNLKMNNPTGKCSFLKEDNKCSIHEHRPGICRMFPLGRYWENDTEFSYILQKGECNKDGLTKIKVKKWIGVDNISEYNDFIVKWHNYLKRIQKAMEELSDEQIRILNMYTLKTFFIKPYECDENSFYTEFNERLENVKTTLGL
ncbi:MAG: YkgJ family cysteine cluster protein [Lachnospira sp.]